MNSKKRISIFNIKAQYHHSIVQMAKKIDDCIQKHNLLDECMEKRSFCRGFIVVEKIIKKPHLLFLAVRPTRYKKHDPYMQNIVEYWCPILPSDESCGNSHQKFVLLSNYYKLKVEKDFIHQYFSPFWESKDPRLSNLSYAFIDLYWLRCSGDELKYLLNSKCKSYLEEQKQLTIKIITEIQPTLILPVFESHFYLTSQEKKILQPYYPESLELLNVYPDVFQADGDIDNFILKNLVQTRKK